MNRNAWRRLVSVVAILVCLVYLTYRVVFTLNLSSPYAWVASLALYIAECYGVVSLFLYILQVWDVQEPPQQPVLEDKTVDVFVPTYNEDVELLRTTLQACVEMDYPHRTILCDDGGTEARLADPEKGEAAAARAAKLKALCEELGVTYIARPDNMHNKAGNLNYALDQTDGEFVVFFDADHVPEKHFITHLLGYFRDPDLGYVQTPHAFYNFDSFQARHDPNKDYYWDEGQLFHNVIQVGRNAWGCPIFAGSAAMFRRKALEAVNGIATETITEDLHTGMRVNAAGWRSLAVSERLVAGEAAPDATTFHTQRLRWATGNMSIARFDNPLTMRGLGLAQRLSYFASMFSWTAGMFKPFIYLTPILMLFTGVPPVKEITWTLAGITAAYLFISIYTMKLLGNGYASWWNGELFSMAQFWTFLRGAWQTVTGQGTRKFVVTRKRGRQSKKTWPYYVPHMLLIVLSLAAVAWGWFGAATGISFNFVKPVFATFWAVFHSALAWVVIYRSLWPDDGRGAYRHSVRLPLGYTGQDGSARQALTLDLSETGASVLAYERLDAGHEFPVSLSWQGAGLSCRAKVVWMTPVVKADMNKPAGGAAGGYRCGLTFLNLTPAQRGELAKLALNYGVALQYQNFDPAAAADELPEGQAYQLPMELLTEESESVRCVTRSVGQRGMEVVSGAKVEAGRPHRFRLEGPFGPIEGTANVAAAERRQVGGHWVWHTTLRPTGFEGQARSRYQSLSSGMDWRSVKHALRPRRGTRRVPYLATLAACLFLAAGLIGGEFFLFRQARQDDLFLRGLIDSTGPVAQADLDRLESIWEESNPGEDRELLLYKALSRVGQGERRGGDLSKFLDQNPPALVPMPAPNQAELARLTGLVTTGKSSREQRLEFLLNTARAKAKANDIDAAAANYGIYLQAKQDDHEVRNEFASVLIRAEKYREAADAYFDEKGAVLADARGLKYLLFAAAYMNDVGLASRYGRLALDANPADAESRGLLAEVVKVKQGGDAAETFFNRLLGKRKTDPVVRARLGLLSLNFREFDKALDLLQPLATDPNLRPEFVRGYIDAVSSATDPEKIDKPLLAQVAGRAARGGDPFEDAVALERMAWALQRTGQHAEAAGIYRLAQNFTAGDKDRLHRKELTANMAAGQWDQALKVLSEDGTDSETSYLRVGIYMQERRYDDAAREIGRLLDANPLDIRARRLRADLLIAQGKYDDAGAELNGLLAQVDRKGEVERLMADLNLYKGDYAEALKRYAALERRAPGDPQLQSKIIDAAAGAPSLTDDQKKLLVEISESYLRRLGDDPTRLTRLAWVMFQLGDEDRAKALADQARSLKPAAEADRRQLSNVYAALGRFDDAVATVNGLAESPEDRFRVIALLAEEEDLPEAEAHAMAILEDGTVSAKDRARAQDLVVNLMFQQERFAEAARFMEARLGKTPGGDESLLRRLADASLYARDYSQAATRYAALLKVNPDDDLRSRFIDAAAEVATKGTLTAEQTRQAVVTAKELYGKAGADPKLLSRLGWVLIKGGEAGEGRKLLARAAEREPADPAVRRELAGALAAAGDFEAALKVHGEKTLTSEAREEVARLKTATSDFKGAAEALRELAAASPDNAGLQELLAQNLLWAKDYDGAREVADRMLTANPGDAAALTVKARSHLYDDEAAAALPLYIQAMKADPSKAILWGEFAAAAAGAASEGKLSEDAKAVAANVAGKLIGGAAWPEDAAFPLRLGYVLVKAGRAEEAVPVLLKAGDVARDAETRRQVAGNLLAVEAHKEARVLLEKADELAPEDYLMVGLARLAEADKLPGSVEEKRKHLAAAETALRAADVPGLRPEAMRAKARIALADALSGYADQCRKANDNVRAAEKFNAAVAILRGLGAGLTVEEARTVRQKFGSNLLAAGRVEDALQVFREMLSVNVNQPGLWKPYLDAAATRSVKKLIPGDRPILEYIYRKAPGIGGARADQAEFCSRLAACMQKLGRIDYTVNLLRRTVKLTGLPVHELRLAQALTKLGRHDEAAAYYNRVLNRGTR